METISIKGSRLDKVKNGCNLIIKGMHILKRNQVVTIYNPESKERCYVEVKNSIVCSMKALNQDDAKECGFHSLDAMVNEINACDTSVHNNLCTILKLAHQKTDRNGYRRY